MEGLAVTVKVKREGESGESRREAIQNLRCNKLISKDFKGQKKFNFKEGAVRKSQA